jgi:mannose-6-phosphate isomerase class I
MVARADRHARRVHPRRHGGDAGWITQEEWTMKADERIAEIMIGICMAGFVGLLVWSLV